MAPHPLKKMKCGNMSVILTCRRPHLASSATRERRLHTYVIPVRFATEIMTVYTPELGVSQDQAGMHKEAYLVYFLGVQPASVSSSGGESQASNYKHVWKNVINIATLVKMTLKFQCAHYCYLRF